MLVPVTHTSTRLVAVHGFYTILAIQFTAGPGRDYDVYLGQSRLGSLLDTLYLPLRMTGFEPAVSNQRIRKREGWI